MYEEVINVKTDKVISCPVSFAYCWEHGPRRTPLERELDKADSNVSLRSAVAILISQPFDRSTFEDLLDKQKQYANSTQSSAHTALITHIENMTKQERLAFAQRLEVLMN